MVKKRKKVVIRCVCRKETTKKVVAGTAKIGKDCLCQFKPGLVKPIAEVWFAKQKEFLKMIS